MKTIIKLLESQKQFIIAAKLRKVLGGVKESEVGKITEDFLKKVKSLMKKKGYKYKKTKQSALADWSFIKDDEEYRQFSLSGWHGDGRYGSLKLITDLYDITEKYGRVEEADIFKMPGQTKGYGQGMPEDSAKLNDQEFEAYKKNIKKALIYLEKNA